MLNCNVTPHDDDEDDNIQLLNFTGFYYNYIKFKENYKVKKRFILFILYIIYIFFL